MTIDTSERWLDLLAHTLVDWFAIGPGDGSRFFSQRRNGEFIESAPPETLEERRAWRREGRDWPARALTMIGLVRLAQLRRAIETVIAEEIPGDVVETGVWQGGACILAKAVLEARGGGDRNVWLCDSFQGLPKPSRAEDAGWDISDEPFLKVSADRVRENFAAFGLLDERVRLIEGWFADTLPGAPIDRIAVLRLDGDLYGSTMDALAALYPKVSPGGFVIVDDWSLAPCRQAVEDFRAAHAVLSPLEPVDWTGVFWRVPG